MRTPVARTCTEIPPEDSDRAQTYDSKPITAYRSEWNEVTGHLSRNKPISEYRSAPAYVLLGDPGAGKTTEFRKECEELGDEAVYVTARNFVTLGLGNHQSQTIFIDGLDEIRASKLDARVPLDKIRERLDNLRRPRFRISCRAADWLGPNDHQHLAYVSPDSKITVLRLDPLSDQAIRELLNRWIPSSDDAQEFEEKAAHRGLRPLLHNPKMLGLLVEAVGSGETWPDSRLETLEMACLKMAGEHNDEHKAARQGRENQVYEPEAVIDAAGYLCALTLLSNCDGYTLVSDSNDGAVEETGLASLDSLGSLKDTSDTFAHTSHDKLKQALSSKLFIAVGEDETGFVPCHRLVAEFLAGRHLAKLIEEGLPVRRVMSLMTGPHDGGVVTVLRGLSAWLATQSGGEARRQLIEADPVGVGLYGDIRNFTLKDKERLLRSLAEFTQRIPISRHQHQYGLVRGGLVELFQDDTIWAFHSLASRDMVAPIRKILESQHDEVHNDWTAAFVLKVLAHAEASEKKELADLESDLTKILNNPQTPSEMKQATLDAYIHIVPDSKDRTQTLKLFLEKVQSNPTIDPDDELRGTLLEHLYPEQLSATEVWQYSLPRNRPSMRGNFYMFWKHILPQQSSDQRAAELLDASHEDVSRLLSLLEASYPEPLEASYLEIENFNHLPIIQLLARCLNTFGETLEIERLLGWLDTAGHLSRERFQREEEENRFVREWLESHPHIQKAVCLAWLRQQVVDNPTDSSLFELFELSGVSYYYNDFLNNIGLWHLDRATTLEDSEPVLAQKLLELAYYEALGKPPIREGLTLEIIRKRVSAGTGVLARRFDELCNQHATNSINHDNQRSVTQDTDSTSTEHSSNSASNDDWRQQIEERKRRYNEKKSQKRKEWAEHLRSQLNELRNNKYSPHNLNTLATVYLGLVVGVNRMVSPQDRISDFLGGDETLVDAVMTAIRGAVFREDVPKMSETISLGSESKHSWLAYPVLACLHLLDEKDPASLDGIGSECKRKALAIYYCMPHYIPYDDLPSHWHDRWFRQDPDLVLDVLYKCAVSAVRSGAEYASCLNDLDRISNLDSKKPILKVSNRISNPEEPMQDTQTQSTAVPMETNGCADRKREESIHRVRLQLLEAIPARAPNKQMKLLDRLLARTLRHPNTTSLHKLAAKKLSLKSMTVAQRVRWLAIKALLSHSRNLDRHATPDAAHETRIEALRPTNQNLDELKEYVCENEMRIRHLAEFLHNTSPDSYMQRSILTDVRTPAVLEAMIEILGSLFSPLSPFNREGTVTLGMDMSELVTNLINQLGALPSEEGHQSLVALIDNQRLQNWHTHLVPAHESQRIIYRDASYKHPSIEQVQNTLSNRTPANAADLAALLVDWLHDIAKRIRGDNSNIWRQFWNEDKHRRPNRPKTEESCRDVLLAILKSKSHLLNEISVTPEGRYVSEKRADITASCRDFNIPIEIKKNSHQHLWTALRQQLIGQYTTDPATSDYGIYLVLWFGREYTQKPPHGDHPSTPEELRQHLRQDLAPDEARNISVIVLDVTKP